MAYWAIGWRTELQLWPSPIQKLGRSVSPALFCRQRATTSGSTRAPGRRLDEPSFWAIRTPFQATRTNASVTRQASSIVILGIPREDEILYLDVGCPQGLEENQMKSQLIAMPVWRRWRGALAHHPISLITVLVRARGSTLLRGLLFDADKRQASWSETSILND